MNKDDKKFHRGLLRNCRFGLVPLSMQINYKDSLYKEIKKDKKENKKWI